MPLIVNTRTYNLDRYNSPDSVTYAASGHTPASKDQMTLSRTYPKAQSDFAGVAKPYFKRTRTVVVNATTGETRDLILYIGGSVPVGTPSADLDLGLADLASFAGGADAKALFKSLDVNV